MIRGWYIEGLNAESFPRSLAELEARFLPIELSASDLPAREKWEPIISQRFSDLPDGWIELGEIADFRRGIATGCNSFFLVSEEDAEKIGVREHHRNFCIGRSADVSGLAFSADELDTLRRRNRRVVLLDFTNDLSIQEREYVRSGESQGIHERYLTRTRTPWFSMEKRPPAPIWAAVFGRDDLRFVLNEAAVLSLTNFHCVFPVRTDQYFLKTLCLLLNSQTVRARFDQAGRKYGGGLKKFEPNDLKRIHIPDLRRMEQETLEELAGIFDSEINKGKSVSLSSSAEKVIDLTIKTSA